VRNKNVGYQSQRAGMKQVIKIGVLPTEAEAMALDATLRTCNAPSSWLSQQMLASRIFRKFDVHHRFYSELRERFGLASQPTIRVIGKVADAYASLAGQAPMVRSDLTECAVST